MHFNIFTIKMISWGDDEYFDWLDSYCKVHIDQNIIFCFISILNYLLIKNNFKALAVGPLRGLSQVIFSNLVYGSDFYHGKTNKIVP